MLLVQLFYVKYLKDFKFLVGAVIAHFVKHVNISNGKTNAPCVHV